VAGGVDRRRSFGCHADDRRRRDRAQLRLQLPDLRIRVRLQLPTNQALVRAGERQGTGAVAAGGEYLQEA
jgi:hypothetical protein